MTKPEQLAQVWAEAEADPAFALLRSQDGLAVTTDWRARFVPGDGNVDADLAIVGEAPGRNEDEQGRPFVGQAGDLLWRELRGVVGLERDQVWVTNVVKYRPRLNRTPIPAESRAGSRHLRHELAIVRPRVVLVLGATPLRLLRPTVAITQVHGQPFTVKRPNPGRTYLPTFHPAYILRRRDLLGMFRADLGKLRMLLDHREGSHE